MRTTSSTTLIITTTTTTTTDDDNGKNNIMTSYLHVISGSLTSAVGVAQVRESPHVAEPDRVTNAGEEEVRFARPLFPLRDAIRVHVLQDDDVSLERD